MHFTCMKHVSVAGTYIPRKEVTVVETIKATVIRENQAIRLRARKEGVDRGGVRRVTGGESLILHSKIEFTKKNTDRESCTQS